MFTIVGLGNPGAEYETTRHNVGWIVLEEIIKEHSLPSLTKSSAYSGLISEGMLYGKEIGILFPTTFMNNSGTAVSKYVKERGSLDTLIVVHDEIDLPFGDVRIAYDRGSGGHNGIKSITDALGSKQFVRIRIGIAQKSFFGGVKRPKGDRLADYVLANFKGAELKELHEIGKKVERALELTITRGREFAMGEINKS